MSPWLTTLLVSMTPIGELRAGIPVGLTAGLPWWEVYLIAVVGNLIPAILLLLFLEPVSNWMRKQWKWAEQFFTWLFERTRRRGKVVDRYKALGLMIFVMIPLPITGAWTGSAAAFIFGVPNRFAIPAVIGGVMLAGAIVTLVSLGVIGMADLILAG